MKKLFVSSILIFCLTIVTRSQITKGNWLVGGNLSYSKSNSKGVDATNSKGRNIDVTSTIGHFLYDKLAAGIKLNTIFSKQKNPEIDGTYSTNIQNSIGIGSFVRYYLLEFDNRINIFPEASILQSFLSNNITDKVEKTWAATVSAGTVIFLNSSVGLEFLFSYNHIKVLEIDSKGNVFQFKIGFQIHLEKNK